MTPFAIIDGTGTYRLPTGTLLRPGANPITDEEAEQLEKSSPRWVIVQETRDVPVPAPAAASPPAPPAPYDKFQGRDSKWYYHAPTGVGQDVEQSEGFLTEEEVDSAIFEAQKPKVPLAEEIAADKNAQGGTLTPGDLPSPAGYGCNGADCDRTFSTSEERTNHERIKHPDLFEAPTPPPIPQVDPPSAPEHVGDPNAGVVDPEPPEQIDPRSDETTVVE